MIVPDVNLLIYAVDSDSADHDQARRWLEETLSGTEAVGLAWVVILAFLRLTTRGDVFRSPLTPERALDYVEEWLQLPVVRPLGAADNHWSILRGLLRSSGTAGNLTSDAHLAALALEHGAAVHSADNDFRRFAGVEHVNPLSPGKD